MAEILKWSIRKFFPPPPSLSLSLSLSRHRNIVSVYAFARHRNTVSVYAFARHRDVVSVYAFVCFNEIHDEESRREKIVHRDSSIGVKEFEGMGAVRRLPAAEELVVHSDIKMEAD